MAFKQHTKRQCSSTEAETTVGEFYVSKYQQDEGWAWIVLLGSTITMFLAHLPVMSFGILYGPILENFNVSSAQIGWINGSFCLIWNSAVLFLGPLCNEFGWKNVGMWAAAINASGVFLSAWIPRPSVLYLYVSLLGGIGGTTVVSMCFFVVPHYFIKRRVLAMAINSLGTCGSLLIGPPLALFLSNHFGTTWTFFILGAFLLNGIPSTWVFHPLEWHPKTAKADTLLQKVQNDSNVDSENVLTLNLRKTSLGTKLLTVLKGTFRSFHLLKQRKVIHICISQCCILIGFITFQMWIPFAIIDRGYSRETASMCLSGAGFGNVLGRLSIVIFADCSWVNTLILFKFSLALTSVSILIFAQVGSLAALGGSAALWGFSIGQVMALYHMSLIQVVGLKAFPETFGLSSLFAGIFVCILGPVIGVVKDQSTTFYSALSVIGVMVAIACILWATMPMSANSGRRTKILASQESL